MSTLAYLKKELSFNLKDWQALEADTKDSLRQYAEMEMKLLEIEVTVQAK